MAERGQGAAAGTGTGPAPSSPCSQRGPKPAEERAQHVGGVTAFSVFSASEK